MSCHDPKEALLGTLQAPRRNRYFYGKRLDVQHMQMEQDHGQHKQWMLNRLTVGSGVVCGLHVEIDDNRLCVSPGMAIDGLGREIVVPVRACIDPFAPDDGCDCTPGAKARRDPQPDASLATLWLCYHECLADPQATMVSDCNSSATCTPGTTVETFCLKVVPGVPALQGDPDFCARLWPKAHEPRTEPNPNAPLPAGPGELTSRPMAAIDANAGDLPLAHTADTSTAPSLIDLVRAKRSHRHLLCELFDDPCDDSAADPCVPLAVVRLADGRITHLESCLVRPRIYSNARLLDLILCLADKIEECCGHDRPTDPPPPRPQTLMRVASVDFLRREDTGAEAVIASMVDPTAPTSVSIGRNVNAIRIRFTTPFAQDAHMPSTHGLGDPDFKRHNVQVLPQDVLDHLDYVPGSLVVEAADTVRFDLFPDSPYVRGAKRGWQKGRYTVLLRGDDATAAGRPAINDLAGLALDGEATVLTAAAISGDGVAGGDFKAEFVVG